MGQGSECQVIHIAFEAVGKRPSAVRQAHGPEQSRRTALPSSLVTAAYFNVRLTPRDFGSLTYGRFPTVSIIRCIILEAGLVTWK